MDNENDNNSNDKNKTIVSGLFGVAGEENNSDSDCIAIAEDNADLSKSIKFDDPETMSFAKISENYSKRAADDMTTIAEESTNACNPDTEVDTKSTVILPKGGLPSTLSMISRNYPDSDSDDSSSEDSSSNSDINSDDSDDNSIISVSSDTASRELAKTKGELDIKDLPPIEDLKISVDENKCEPVGCIKNIVDTLVIVEASLNLPALDIDSVLFVNRGRRALGKIFDVFGPVTKPYYAIRFNSLDHINQFNIQINDPVYFAPHTEYVSFVFISKLMQMKGSDASWKNNNEPPPEYLDYSDDEAEKLAKKNRKQKKSNKSEESTENLKNKNKSLSRSNVTSSPQVNNTPNLPTQYSNRPQQQFNSHQPNYNHGIRPFPTYAQQLSSVEYSHTYRHPWSYNQMYPQPPQNNNPQNGYPYQDPYNVRPRFNYQTPQQPMNHNYQSPPQQMNHNYQNSPQPMNHNYQSPPQPMNQDYQIPPQPMNHNYQTPPQPMNHNYQHRPSYYPDPNFYGNHQ